MRLTSFSIILILFAVMSACSYSAVRSDPVLKNYPVFNTYSAGDEDENAGLQYLVVPAGAVSNSSNPDGVLPQFAGQTKAICV